MGKNMMSLIDDHDPIQPMKVPIIDLSLLSQDSHLSTSLMTKEIHEACQKSGVFHVVNHGISELVMHEALDANQNFFDMPEIMKKEILELGGCGMLSPVHLTTFKRRASKTDLLQRDLMRLYANPLEDFIDFWPKHPVHYREKMGRYTKEARKLGIQLFGAIMESLNLGATHLKQNLEQGMHSLVANNYSPCPESSVKIGAPPHSDHSIITILLQSSPGLQVLNMADGTWKAAPKVEGSLQVFVGDHLEVLSNGIYKSVFHCVIPSSEKTRMSIASFHSFQIDEIVEPATELIHQNCPKNFRGSRARELLKHISTGEFERLIDSHRI